ncbi:MAG: metallophosphoesterase [Candidatus Hydrogenedentes bacterium]|nr:metallophosphoesterase [Candidatus Hydrogenedentota bacterium]
MNSRMRYAVFTVMGLLALLIVSLGVGAETLAPAPEGTFTLAVIPDTQRYLGPGTGRDDESGAPRNPAFDSRTSWLAANIEVQRIVFITHTGDVVDKNEHRQWQIARANMDRIHGKVPYGISVGNHDMAAEPGDSRLFQEYFGAERYTGQPWYGGTYEGFPGHTPEVSGNNANSYQLFSAGGLDFVIVHLECNAPDDVLDWADGVIESYRNRMAIISTHMYLGGIPKKGADQPQGRMQWKKVHGARGNTPQQLWEKSFIKHPNLFLTLCGDQSASIAWRQTSRGAHGNAVHELLADYPRNADDSDWLRLLRFDPANGQIEVFTYSPAQDRLCESIGHTTDRSDHQFVLDISRAIADHKAQREPALATAK